MIEAAIVAVSILAAAGGAVWQAGRLSARHTLTLTRSLTDLEARLGAFSAGQYDDNARLRLLLEMHLPELVFAVRNEQQWTALSEVLLAEMATIRSRMDDQAGQWRHLATRIQTNVGHRALRIP